MHRPAAVPIAIAVAIAVAQAGCLSQTYKIPRRELTRLAETPPEQRGAGVRVVQEFGTADAPPPAGRVSTSTQIVIVGGVGTHHHHGGGGPRPAPGGPRPGGPRGSLAKNKSDEAWVWVVLAAGAAVGLAVTEGARYDGWVEVHPMHPVHVYGPWGYAVVPLAQLDAGTAAAADRAVIRPYEGPWRTLGRAPLDRAGFTYSVLGGAAAIPGADGSTDLGPAFHIQLGYFPTHQVGIVADASLSWRDNAVGATIYDNRWGLELEYLPLDAGHFHAGLFGGIALGSRVEDGEGREQGIAYGGGAMVQLSLTTRLALTGRFGIGQAYDETTNDVTVGLSIY
jgi:hypothetical protein